MGNPLWFPFVLGRPGAVEKEWSNNECKDRKNTSNRTCQYENIFGVWGPGSFCGNCWTYHATIS